MPMVRIALLLVLAVSFPAVASAVAPRAVPKRLPKEQVDFFEQKIRPVLVHSCYECHAGDAAKAKGHFVLDNRDGIRKGGESGAAILPGNPDHSPLIEALRYEQLEMPPKGKLPDEVIDDFARWVEMGAPDPRFGAAANPKNKVDLASARRYWAFQPPKAWPVPSVRDSKWPRSDIDRFVLAGLEAEGLKPVGDADRAALLRRLTFDLSGLPPTPEELFEFLADRSPEAYPKVVDRLLASPRFGERWGRHWLDVVRYGDSSGKDRNIPYRFAWRYRNYVIDAFNADKPYNRFVVEQLAGDLLPSRDAGQRDQLTVATGLLALGPKAVNVTKPEIFRMEQIDDQIDVTTRAFLGLTVACARCHDHKFDPIPTADYYAMAGIFNSTRTFSGLVYKEKSAHDDRLVALSAKASLGDVSQKEIDKYKAIRRQADQAEAELADLRKEARQGAAAGKGGKKGQFAKSAGMNKNLRDEIKDLQDKVEDLRSTPSPFTNLAMGVADAETPSNCHILERGDVDHPAAEVQRGLLTVLKTAATAQIPARASGRLQLARWIASPDNPLTARVMANRVWSHLLGQGLVDSIDNFGALGNQPSHPELLDVLAVQFVHDGWSVKKLIRSIVLSHVYQLASDHDAKAYEKDPDDRLYWRMERRRLDAEEIRDALLLAGGELDFKRPEGSETLKLANKQVFGPRALAGMQPGSVRSVYLPIVRGQVPDVLQVFDMADPNLIVGQRDVTTVPTQALFMMNNPLVIREASLLARKLLVEKASLSEDDKIALAFRTTLNRSPTDSEAARVKSFVRDYRQSLQGTTEVEHPNLAAWASFCQTLFATGEFRYAY